MSVLNSLLGKNLGLTNFASEKKKYGRGSCGHIATGTDFGKRIDVLATLPGRNLGAITAGQVLLLLHSVFRGSRSVRGIAEAWAWEVRSGGRLP